MESGTPGLKASQASSRPTRAASASTRHGRALELENDQFAYSDARQRRVWWVDDFIPVGAWIFGQGPGEGSASDAG